MKKLLLTLLFPTFLFSQTSTKEDTTKSVIKITDDKHKLVLINNYLKSQLYKLYEESIYKRDICLWSNNQVCKIPEHIYIEKAQCLLNNYQFMISNFVRLQNNTDEELILSDPVLITTEKKYKNSTIELFPKCFNSKDYYY